MNTEAQDREFYDAYVKFHLQHSSKEAPMESNRIVYVGTRPDGSQIFVERFLDDDGNETLVQAAERPKADTRLPWGPPITLERE